MEQILRNAALEALVYGLLPIASVALVTYALAYTFLKRQFDAVTIAAFAAVGCFLGIFIGGSRAPAVGAVLPAIIAFVGTLVAYYFSKEKEVFDRKLMPPTILALVVSAAVGSSFAAELRATTEQFEFLRELEKSHRDSTLRRDEKFQESVVNVINRYAICVKQFDQPTCEKIALAK
jgi:hypothetical protein